MTLNKLTFVFRIFPINTFISGFFTPNFTHIRNTCGKVMELTRFIFNKVRKYRGTCVAQLV